MNFLMVWERPLQQTSFQRSSLIMDSIICSKFYSSEVPKKTIAKIQFRLEKHNRGCALSLTECSTDWRMARTLILERGKLKMVFKGYAPVEISFPLAEYGIEWENPLSTFALRGIQVLATLYILVKKKPKLHSLGN